MRRTRVLLYISWLFGFGPVLARAADEWPAIAPEVWAMREDAATGTVGAVILESRIKFRAIRLEYTYRVRILSEQGRDAAAFPLPSRSAYGLEGRTVYPDGTSVPFSEKTEFRPVMGKPTLGSARVFGRVPPGVNGNCVVELRWYESTNPPGWAGGTLPPEYGRFHEWELGSHYRTLLSVVDLGPTFNWAYEISGLDTHKPEVNGRVFTIRNLPAVERAPLSLPPLRPAPRLTAFWQPPALSRFVREGEAAYWNAVARLEYKPLFSKVSKGGEYEAFAREILAGLPPDPATRALALRAKLDARIVNTDAMTVAEKALRTASERRRPPDPGDLGAAVRRGNTTGFGMLLLFLELARDAGLRPTVALVADRDERLFRPALLAPFQLGQYSWYARTWDPHNGGLVGITVPGAATLWLDPSLRFGSATILPAYQGTAALELDTEAWTLKPISIPTQPAASNVRRFAYELDLREKSDAFKVKAQFSGYPDYLEHRRFGLEESAEQVRRLKESLQEEIAGAEVTRTQVDHAQDPAANVEWAAEGRIEAEPARRRAFRPFPAMPWPLRVSPAALSSTRTAPIVMPYLQVHAAEAIVRVPAGYRLITGEPVEHSNSFGSVSLTTNPTASGVSAVLRVEITKLVQPAEAYADLKEFLAWIEDACGRSFILEKE